ncbi:hypothetical protein NC652_037292 [Populus alba x Populus x berolinensis]|nr:hypothetical protein NC652_037292 [Populus alba x Populus x berolinensis]
MCPEARSSKCDGDSASSCGARMVWPNSCLLIMSQAGEKGIIESRGGFESILTLVGDVPRVDGQHAVARAFGNKSLKIHLSSET